MTTATANDTAAATMELDSAQVVDEAPAQPAAEPTKEDISTYWLALKGILSDIDRQLDAAPQSEVIQIAWKRRALNYLLNLCYAPKEEVEDSVPGVSGVKCRTSERGNNTAVHGVNFDWRMRITSRKGDKTHQDERTCSMDVYVMPTEDYERHQRRGGYSYCQAADIGNGWSAVCDLTFDGISESERSDDPESRAMLKPIADDLLKWLEARNDLGYTEICKSTNGRTQVRFELTSGASPDDDNDHPVIELMLDRDSW